jgi:hypothetical protein
VAADSEGIMETKHFEEDDPFEFVNIALDVPSTPEYWAGMARTFIEEYTLMGWKDSDILALFKNPMYRASHQALRVHGEPFIKNLISEVRNG